MAGIDPDRRVAVAGVADGLYLLPAAHRAAAQTGPTPAGFERAVHDRAMGADSGRGGRAVGCAAACRHCEWSRQMDSPLLLGVWRPTIILPAGVEEKFDEGELRLMLAHELAHCQRHDLAWNWVPTVAGWLFFFHPLVWLMAHRWSEAQEAACDELVIQQQGRPSRPSYGRLLVKLAALAPAETNLAPAAAGVLGAYRNLERRILAMARVKPFSPRRLMVAAGACSRGNLHDRSLAVGGRGAEGGRRAASLRRAVCDVHVPTAAALRSETA